MSWWVELLGLLWELNEKMSTRCLAHKVLNKYEQSLWWWRWHSLAQNLHWLLVLKRISSLGWHLRFSTNWSLSTSQAFYVTILCVTPVLPPSWSMFAKRTETITTSRPLVLSLSSSHHVQVLQGPGWHQCVWSHPQQSLICPFGSSGGLCCSLDPPPPYMVAQGHAVHALSMSTHLSVRQGLVPPAEPRARYVLS